MRKITQVYQFANLLSLDIVAGAIVSCLFFARIFRVTVLPWGFAALGLSVWIIYTVDHLLDARRISRPASTDRHRFHQEHFRTLLFLLFVAALGDAIAVSLLRRPVLNMGLALGAIAGLYLLFQGRLKSWKELSGAMLYCAGVALPAFSLSNYPVSAFEGLLMMQFAITAFCNLLLFSLFDLQDDLRDKHSSFVTVMGERKTRLILAVLFCLNAALIGFQLLEFRGSIGASVVMLTMNGVLFLIFVFPKFFRANRIYRLLGDAIFLVPIFFLLI